MTFFSSTDTGVTTNRFSQDLMLIDMELPLTALNTFASMNPEPNQSSQLTRVQLLYSALRRWF
jgi:hypothetical protein